MGNKQYERFNKLYGKGSSDKLKTKNIILFGVGGVGSFTAEALIRSGIGNITLVDPDIVDITNLNRQLQATHLTIGKSKVNVLKDRLLSINPDAKIIAEEIFFDETKYDFFNFSNYDYIIDAIDSIKSKILIVKKAKESEASVICSMGAGNKKDPTRFRVTDISKTSVCPLAKIMRRELRKLDIKNVKAVWSDEMPIKISDYSDKSPGSSAFVPSVAGLVIASEVIKDLLEGF